MGDIRLITGKNIQPVKETVLALLGCKNADEEQTQLYALYDRLLPLVKMHIRPKAAFIIKEEKLYTMLTLGDGISRLIEKYTLKEDLLSATLLDAMADSSLFVFEEQLLPILGESCRVEGYGIADRLEIPTDISIEEQQRAYEILEAKRTLGLAMTSGYMLNPVKSMSLFFALTKDITCQNMQHDCSKCENQSCSLRKETQILLQIEEITDNSGDKSSQKKQIFCQRGSNLLTVLRENAILQSAPCNGKGKCKKCTVVIRKGSLPVTAEDRNAFTEEELQKGMRLACQAVVKENLTIGINKPLETDFAILAEQMSGNLRFYLDNAYVKGYGIAIDIGTTTLAFSLVELQSGKILDAYTMLNSQRCFGADVISRIDSANTGQKEQLCQSIKKDLCCGIEILLKKNPQSFIHHIVIAANTVMLHLLQGYSCEGFCRYPFTPENLGIEEFSVIKLFKASPESMLPKGLSMETQVTLLPCISAFVGADITAGIYVSGMWENTENSLFLDLGTNGEMALKVQDKLYVASTAAGPAFEGGNIKWGVGSIAGAIARVDMQKETVNIQTIDNQPPVGICGTGVIESVAELLKAEIMDRTGRLSDAYFAEGYPLAQTKSGEKICFTQQDIREVQMAKAAIRAGIEILLLKAGISYKDISKLYIAGGFGFYLDVKKAAETGLLPKELVDKSIAVGNTALRGAAVCLINKKAKETMAEIAQTATEIPLALEEKFQEYYIDFMQF